MVYSTCIYIITLSMYIWDISTSTAKMMIPLFSSSLELSTPLVSMPVGPRDCCTKCNHSSYLDMRLALRLDQSGSRRLTGRADCRVRTKVSYMGTWCCMYNNVPQGQLDFLSLRAGPMTTPNLRRARGGISERAEDLCLVTRSLANGCSPLHL